MKRLNTFLKSLIVALFSVAFFSVSAAGAFQNLSTTGSGTTGGSGATPSLSQVTAVGAITTDAVTLNGGLTVTTVNATGATTLRGGTTISNLTVTGTAAVQGNTTLSNTTVTGTLALSQQTKQGVLFVGNTGQATTTGVFTYTTSTNTLLVTNVSSTGAGQIIVGDGSATNPSIVFGNDDGRNTGIFSGGANNINFSVFGTQSLLINQATGILPSANFVPLVNNTYSLGLNTLAFSTLHVTTVSSTNIAISGAVTTTKLDVTGAATSTFFGLGGVSSTKLTLSSIPIGSGAQNGLCILSGGEVVQESSCVVSSARFKERIDALAPKDLMEKARKLRAVGFDWKKEYLPFNGVNANRKESSGFIAEEVALIDPLLAVYTSKFSQEDLEFEKKNYPGVILEIDGVTYIPQSVDYQRMSYVSMGAIQYLDEQDKKQKEINEDIARRMKEIENNSRVMEGRIFDRVVEWIKSIF